SDMKWSRVINQGLIAGGMLLFVGMVGMLAAFEERQIVQNFFTLAQLVIVAIPCISAFMATRRVLNETKQASLATYSCLLVGALTAVPSLILLWLTDLIPNINDILINVNRFWIATITFGQESQLLGVIIFFIVVFGAGA